MIKASKRAIKAQLKDAEVTDEQLITIFTGVESLLNSRPLTYQSANNEDVLPLTPNHFLQVGGSLGPEIDRTTAMYPTKRWRRTQEIIQHYWQRWMREWLPSLSQRKKWKEEK